MPKANKKKKPKAVTVSVVPLPGGEIGTHEIQEAADTLGVPGVDLEQVLEMVSLIHDEAVSRRLPPPLLINALTTVMADVLKRCLPKEEQPAIVSEVFDSLWQTLGLPRA